MSVRFVKFLEDFSEQFHDFVFFIRHDVTLLCGCCRFQSIPAGFLVCVTITIRSLARALDPVFFFTFYHLNVLAYLLEQMRVLCVDRENLLRIDLRY